MEKKRYKKPCYAQGKQCFKCSKYGHIEKICQGTLDESGDDEDSDNTKTLVTFQIQVLNQMMSRIRKGTETLGMI